MEKISLIALDIGGMLLSDDNTISDDNLAAISYAQKMGIKIALATAREYSSTRYISNLINSDYGVFSNGSHIMNISTLTTLKKQILEKKAVLEILDYCKMNNIYIHLNQEFKEVSDKLDYFVLKHYLLNKNYPQELKSNCFIVDNLYEYVLTNEITKIVMVSEQGFEEEFTNLKKILMKYNLFITEYNKDLYEHILNKTINYVEIGSCADTKGQGIVDLCDMLNIPREQVLTFGDGENDIEMFDKFTNSICMKNGSDVAKQKVKYITKNDNNYSGVAEGIYKYVKVGR